MTCGGLLVEFNRRNDSCSCFIVLCLKYSGEIIKLNLVELRTAPDFVSWFQVFGV